MIPQDSCRNHANAFFASNLASGSDIEHEQKIRQQHAAVQITAPSAEWPPEETSVAVGPLHQRK